MEPAATGIQEIFTDKISDPQNPMRSELHRASHIELSDNIKQNGLINPITVRTVREHPQGGCVVSVDQDSGVGSCSHTSFEVVAGHRRLAACRIAGIIRIPAVIRDLSDEEAFAVMTAENLERADVPLLDECRHYLAAQKRFGKSIAEIAKAARRSEAYIRSRLAIANMPEYIQAYLQSGELSLGVALELAEITDDPIRQHWVELAVRDGVSVAQAEYWVHGWRVNRLPGGAGSIEPPEGGGEAAAPIVKFRCAIDDREYDARLCRSIIVYEGNMEMFFSVVAELRKAPSV